jgi:hypothetical protein
MGRKRGRMMSVSRNQHAVLWRAWQDSGENLNDIARKAGQDYKAVWRLLRLIKSQSTDRETQAPTLQGVLFRAWSSDEVRGFQAHPGSDQWSGRGSTYLRLSPTETVSTEASLRRS